MTLLMKRITFFASFFFLMGTVTGMMTCNPAEEKTNHTISLTVPRKRENDTIKIDSMYQRLGTCDPSSKICTNANNDQYTFTITESKDVFTVTIFIYNVTRKIGLPEGQWFMAYNDNSVMESKIRCNLTVFAKPEDIRCIHNFFSDRLYVTCIAHKVYPEGICLFRMSINNEDTKEVTPETSNIKIQENPDYYTSSCTIGLTLSRGQSALFKVIVTFYPNVTNVESNIQNARMASHNISIGPPKLINTEEHGKHISVSSTINNQASFQVKIECSPRPKSYRLIKGNHTEYKFDDIKYGRAVSGRYMITFQHEESSYGILTLKLPIVDTTDFNDYIIFINNGISPDLSYTFYIKEEIKSISDRVTLAVSLVTASVIVTSLCVCNVWCCLKRKDFCVGGYSLNSTNVIEDGSVEERIADGNESNNSSTIDEYAVVNKTGAPRKVNYDVLDRL